MPSWIRDNTALTEKLFASVSKMKLVFRSGLDRSI